MKLRRDMHPNGGYFVSLPKEKVKLLDWCEGDVLSVDIVKDLFTIRKVSAREYRQAQTEEVIKDHDHPRKAPDVPKQVAVSKAPAELEIPTVEKRAQEPEKTINIMPEPATKERPGGPGALSGEGHRTCPACDAQVAEHAGRCHRCGADLIALEKQMNIWRQMHKDPTGR